MGPIASRVAAHNLDGLDAALFVCELDDHPLLSKPAHDFFGGLARSRYTAYTSVLTLLEITVRPLQYGLTAIADDCASALTSAPHLR